MHDDGHKPQRRSRPPLQTPPVKKPESAKSTAKSEVKKEQDFEKIVKEQLQELLAEKARKKAVGQRHDIEALSSIVAEFMKSFIILGYDLNGKAVPPIFYANTQMESDALSTYLSILMVNSSHGFGDESD